MLAAVGKIPVGDVILLHACCHNPTGIDPTPEQWKKLADAVYGRGLLPLLDFAYQGFADGIDEDAVGLRAFSRPGTELMVCSSFSKNFGLYCERVGALTIVAKDRQAADTVQSQVKVCIRSNYSNPPAHGAELVVAVLGDAELRKLWEREVAQMRGRINGMRELLAKTLKAKGVPGDYSFITRQRGMFSFSGLTPPQVEALKQKYSIYIVGSGRINVAGITEQNVGPLCEAIAEVVSKS
jgi:aspartate/tyrosine/aromatic aminotransferase